MNVSLKVFCLCVASATCLPCTASADSSGCAAVHVQVAMNETSCANGPVSRPGKPIYAVNTDLSRAVHGVIIRYAPPGGFEHSIGPFDLAKGSRHYLGCGKSPENAFPYRCVQGTQK